MVHFYRPTYNLNSCSPSRISRELMSWTGAQVRDLPSGFKSIDRRRRGTTDADNWLIGVQVLGVKRNLANLVFPHWHQAWKTIGYSRAESFLFHQTSKGSTTSSSQRSDSRAGSVFATGQKWKLHACRPPSLDKSTEESAGSIRIACFSTTWSPLWNCLSLTTSTMDVPSPHGWQASCFKETSEKLYLHRLGFSLDIYCTLWTLLLRL